MMTEQELKEQFINVLSDEHRAFSFTEEFVADMARNAVNYDSLETFFKYIGVYGCIKCTDILTDNDVCKQIYDKYKEVMESYAKELTSNEYVADMWIWDDRSGQTLPRYVKVCRWCYEMIADEIYSGL